MLFDEFLKEVAPSFGLQWRPFNRRGIKRKVEQRIAEAGLSYFDEYLVRVRQDPQEQDRLAKILTVTISRFFRDREVFHTIETFLIPPILQNRGESDFRIWSIGCASGEEPYSLAILWREKFEKVCPQIHFSILATDIDEALLERAKEGRYKRSSLLEVPEEILKNYFKMKNGLYVLHQTIRESVEFRRHDMLKDQPMDGMDMILCRNLAFTYFSKGSQIDMLKKIAESLREKGSLIVGKDEFLPLIYPAQFVPIFPTEKIYQKFTE